MSALPPKADIRPRDQDVCFGPKGDIAPLGRARTDLVAERGSLSALRRHFVFDQANNGRDNSAGNNTAYCLAGKSTDVDVVAYSGHHWDERTKELATADAANRAGNRVAKRAQTNVLRCCTSCVAA